MLISYIRDNKKHPIGVIVAINQSARGVSVCCPKDKFKKEVGRSIAIGRAFASNEIEIPNRKVNGVKLCDLVDDAMKHMDQRVEKYFQFKKEN